MIGAVSELFLGSLRELVAVATGGNLRRSSPWIGLRDLY